MSDDICENCLNFNDDTSDDTGYFDGFCSMCCIDVNGDDQACSWYVER